VHLDGAPYYTSVLPVGGQQVTGDISIMLKTPMDSAEKIKREAGCAYTPLAEEGEPVIIPGVGGRPPLSVKQKDLAGIIEPRVAEILTMVRDKVAKKGYLKHLGGGVVLTGGGAMIPGVVELAQDVFETAARVGQPPSMGGVVEEYQTPEFATAVGLVQFGESLGVASKRPVAKEEGGLLQGFMQWIKNFFQ
jgi:cell division protein FtsA